MTTTLKIVFWLTILFFVVTLYALTFGQSSTYEFADWKLSRKFYDTIMQGLPIAVLLTLTGTIKRTNDKSKNITIIVLTITNDTLLYRLKANPTTTIMTQTIGQGALGADGYRIVKLEPFLKFWNKTTIIDTTTIDKADWIFVNKKMNLRNGE